MTNNNLLILGAGGHGQVCKEIAELMTNENGQPYFEKVSFLDDKPDNPLSIGLCKDFEKYKSDFYYAFPAIGNNKIRAEWYNMLKRVRYKIPKLVHPDAFISKTAKISEGTVIEAKAVINTNSIIEQGCIIDVGSIIDHNCLIESFTHINLGAIIKANTIIEAFKKIEAGLKIENTKPLTGYRFEKGV